MTYNNDDSNRFLIFEREVLFSEYLFVTNSLSNTGGIALTEDRVGPFGAVNETMSGYLQSRGRLLKRSSVWIRVIRGSGKH